MTVELRPLGVTCNLQCQYCYQNPQRDAGNSTTGAYDLMKMKEAVEAEGGPFSLFGGEPLLVPENDLEDLWAWGLKKFGQNSIQTNGSLINDQHMHMFREYKVHVGISIDGPGDLNDARWQGDLRRTRDATSRTEAAIERLCRQGMPPSIIITIHRNNGTPDKIPSMLDWVRYLDSIGVRWVRLHLLEVESAPVRTKYALTREENITALLKFAELEKQLRLRFDLFSDMKSMLVGDDDKTTCIWNGCDPYTTRAVRGIEGNGQRSNCGRTNKDGIDFVKSSRAGFERYLALYATPQAAGGCLGCRFFLMCKGNCPGTAIDGDWRNRSEHCAEWKVLYKWFEQELLASGHLPVSLAEDRQQLERAFIDGWEQGKQLSMAGLKRDRQDASTPWRAKLSELKKRTEALL